MSSPAPHHSPQSPSDAAEVEAVVRDYAEGWYAGDVERMDRALHSELVKRILADGDTPGESVLRMVTKARMVELTAQGGGDMPDPQIEVTIDDVATDIASARVLTPEYLDFLHLVKTPEGWKIANVLFRVRA